MADMRRCIGSEKFGIEAHEAPVADFPAQPSQKDGLGRMCRPHWTEYTGALRKAALARKAAEGGEAPTTEVPVGKALTRAQRRAAAPMAHRGRPEPAKARAKAVVAATETLAGTAYTDAIGSDEIQAALAIAGSTDAPAAAGEEAPIG